MGLTFEISTGSATQRAKLSEPEARTIFNKARNTASIYENDTFTIFEGPEEQGFAFDSILQRIVQASGNRPRVMLSANRNLRCPHSPLPYHSLAARLQPALRH